MFSNDAGEVADLFQEVLVKLWKGFESFHGKSDIKTWIYRVTLNTCITIDRKKRSRKRTMALHGCRLFQQPGTVHCPSEDVARAHCPFAAFGQGHHPVVA